MAQTDLLKDTITERLKPFKPHMVVLFGSHAYGIPGKDSDIDLYIVTNDDEMPQSWSDNMRIKLPYMEALEDIAEQIPTDIIVHTKSMNRKFVEMNSSFARKIINEGIRLI